MRPGVIGMVEQRMTDEIKENTEIKSIKQNPQNTKQWTYLSSHVNRSVNGQLDKLKSS